MMATPQTKNKTVKPAGISTNKAANKAASRPVGKPTVKKIIAKKEGHGSKAGGLETPLKPAGKSDVIELRLYVAGQTTRSLAAFANLKRICEEHYQGRYRLEVIDLIQNPTLARGDQILAIPTLVRRLPTPVSKIVGDLSDTERVLVGLNIRVLKSK